MRQQKNMSEKKTLGKIFREMRKDRDEPLRVVSAALEIDASVLSKIENGERFPTEEQLEKFSDYFEIAFEDIKAQAIAERIIANYEANNTVLRALKIAESNINAYLVNKNE